MNEQIKKLIEAATVKEHSHGAYGEHEWHRKLDPEKFAELIIAECADMFPDDLSSMRDYTGKACRYMIKEHFGLTKTVVGIEE